MSTPLRILHLEDNPTDATLIAETLSDAGVPCESHRVDRRETYVAALKEIGRAHV